MVVPVGACRLCTVYAPRWSMPTSALFIRTRSDSTVETVPPSDANSVAGSETPDTKTATTAARAERVTSSDITASAVRTNRHKTVIELIRCTESEIQTDFYGLAGVRRGPVTYAVTAHAS